MAYVSPIKEWLTDESLNKIEAWAKRGLTNEEIAGNMGIQSRTLRNWRKRAPEIEEALRRGREVVEFKLENALVKKALGYVETEPEITEEITDRDGVVTKHVKRLTKVYPPDTGAAIFLLKNRLRQYYQDRPKSEEELEGIRLDNEIKRMELDRAKAGPEGAGAGYNGIPSHKIAPVFSKLHFDVLTKKYREFVLPGGRGSTKSSFVSLEIVNLVETNPDIHALCCRQVAENLERSVFNQVLWAIDELGLAGEYKVTRSPLEITKKSTGQKIYFRGLDQPEKLKSFKTPFGYVGAIWFEELDQYMGAESLRKVEQSVIRGGEDFWVFKSFNPPRSKMNWANKYILQPKETMGVYRSTYLDVPREWLGEPFFQEAEYLKETNPDAYLNEYMGEANGSGGNVFPNLNVREITDEEIAGFDDTVGGVDFGWTHPSAFIRVQYQPAQARLYVFDECGGSYITNGDLARMIRDLGVGPEEMVICDSEEPKGIFTLQEEGLRAVKAKKGPGSRDYGFKWLAGLKEIIVDPARTPRFLEQAIGLEYERDREGNITGMIPKVNDDWPDALRYATERYHRRQYDPFK